MLLFVLLQTGGVERTQRSSGDGAENSSSDERSDDRGGTSGDGTMEESETVTNVRLIQPSNEVGSSLPVCMFCCLGMQTHGFSPSPSPQ